MSVIEAVSAEAFTSRFPHQPFAIRHQLAGNPLFTLPRLARLATELPRDQIEYNSGSVAVNQAAEAAPQVELSPDAVVHNIESCNAWMVLKRVNTHPEYRALLETTFKQIAETMGFSSAEAAGFETIEGFVFVSSPHSTTPFHADTEDNFFVQLHGRKFFNLYDNRDRAIASEAALEHSAIRHRNLAYHSSFDSRLTAFDLQPGEGCFVPYQWPHWIRTDDSYSISMAITWRNAPVRWRNDLLTVNSMMRGVGVTPAEPGRHGMVDSAKVYALRAAKAAASPLRRSENMRYALRRLALGKKANYYYGSAGKAAKTATP